MKVPKIIGRSFELWIANPLIIVPFIIQFLSYIILTILFSVLFFRPEWGDLTAPNIEAIVTQLITKMSESYYALGGFILFAVLALFLSCFLLSGSIGIANEICRGKKAKFHDLLEYGKKFWFSYLIVSLLIGLIMIFSLIIGIPIFLAVSLLGFGDSIINAITSVFATLVILFAVIFVPATSLLIVQDLGPLEAIKATFRLSKRNYMGLLGLILALVVINIFINLVPYAGEIIGFLILTPIQTISIVLFVIDRLPSLKQKKK